MAVEFDSTKFMNEVPEKSFWGLFQHPVRRIGETNEKHQMDRSLQIPLGCLFRDGGGELVLRDHSSSHPVFWNRYVTVIPRNQRMYAFRVLSINLLSWVYSVSSKRQ